MVKLSVIVPVYNVEKFVKKCINSIVNQTYKSIEIILVDDGSTDSSGIICDEFAKKYDNIKVIHQANQGLGPARNSGLKIATGFYVAFVDSDDWIEPTMYENMINSLEKNNSDLATCARKIVYDDGSYEDVYCLKNLEILEGENIIKEFLIQRKLNMSACDKIFKREFFDEIYFPAFYYSEDILPIYQILKKCRKAVLTGKPYYNYYVRKGSISRRKFNEKHKGFYIYSRKVAENVREVYPTLNLESDYFEYDALISSYISFKSSKLEKSQLKEYKNKLLSHKKTILRNKYFNKKQKMFLITLFFGVDNLFSKIYNFLRR